MVKLCDFGVAKVGETALTMIGDLGFMAKEVSDNQAGYTKEVDIYSLGIILYTLIFHDRFKSKVEDEVVWKDLDKLEKPDWVSDRLFWILKKMLQEVSSLENIFWQFIAYK